MLNKTFQIEPNHMRSISIKDDKGGQSTARNTFFKEKDMFNKTALVDKANETFRNIHKITVEDIVSSNLRKPAFGHEFYNPPKMDKLLIPVKSMPFGKLKHAGFVDTFAKSKAHVPSPALYSTQTNWATTIKGNKGRFLKKERVTVAGEILKNKQASPSPADYQSEHFHKMNRIRGNYKQ